MTIELKLLSMLALGIVFTLLSDCSYAPIPAAHEAGILIHAR